jgi:hypothetical protein
VHPIAFQLGSAHDSLVWRDDRAGVSRRALDGHPPRPRENISGEKIADVTLWLMVGAILGARAVYVTTYWKDEFASQPFREIFMIQHGGLVYYGGLIGATIAGIIYIRWKKLPLWKTADVLAPSIALGSVFGRIGCLLNGCCYGRACSLPWAIRFPADNSGTPRRRTPVHPTEIYDALLNFCFIFFWRGCSGAKNSTARFLPPISSATPSSARSWNFSRRLSAGPNPFGLTPAQWSASPFSSPASRSRRCSRAA